ncbi:hypothetical protein [Paenibacillus sp. NRS-1760]|uniref:hypothetical protein n=1 Tax=Paenibacillus sp. NRS-1760 TaxID=3233902 RepID=UPI003D269C47
MSTPFRRELRRLGWGLVIAMIDIRLGYFDLLPDIIGYLMVLSALQHLGSIHSAYKKAKYISIVLIILTIPVLFIQTNVTITEFSSIPLAVHFYSQLLFILHILMAYWIFNGLIEMLKQDGAVQLLDTAISRRNTYLVFNILMVIIYPFLLNVEDSWVMLLIAFGILLFIMELLFLRLPFRVSNVREKRSLN